MISCGICLEYDRIKVALERKTADKIKTGRRTAQTGGLHERQGYKSNAEYSGGPGEMCIRDSRKKVKEARLRKIFEN